MKPPILNTLYSKSLKKPRENLYQNGPEEQNDINSPSVNYLLLAPQRGANRQKEAIILALPLSTAGASGPRVQPDRPRETHPGHRMLMLLQIKLDTWAENSRLA